MTPSGQLLPLTRPPLLPPGPRLLSRRHHGHPHARTPLSPPWRAHRPLPSVPLQLSRAPATPAPPRASAAGGGEAQVAATAAEFLTSERVKVAAMLGLALALCNADRVVMSVAIVPLSQAYGWTPSFAGVVQVPTLVDYYGGKRVMAYGVALWSLATFLSPWAAGRSIWLFLFTRVLLGIAEGVALPSMNNMVSRWFPHTERSSAVGIAMAGFQLGNTIGLLLSPIIMSRTGIFGPFVIFGLFGFLWVLVWIPAISGTPGEHAQISAYELEYITKGQKLVKPQSGSEKPKKVPPFSKLLSKWPTWALISANAMHSWGYFVILSWMPVYFKTIYHVNLREAAWFSALPWVMMAVLGYVAGVVSDSLIRNGTSITLTRKIMQSIGFLGPGIALLGLNAAKSPILASAWLTIAVGLKSFGHSGFLVNLQEIAPQYAGVLHGMSNTAGTFAAILGTVGAGFFVDRMGSFRGFLILTSLLYFSSALFWDIFATGERVDFDSNVMQAARNQAFTTGHQDFSSFNHEFQSDLGFSMTSTCAPHSRIVNKKVRSSRSFWKAAVSRISSTSSTSTSRQTGETGQKKSWQEQFTFQDICIATSNFSEENKIGIGNFGTVYKGRLRDGSIIAVKRATKNMFDRKLYAEFRNEIQTLSKVEHLNLVKFLGYLEYEDERLILVEYVSNGTLRQHLDGSRGEPLEFSQRLNIAIDIVHAIAYLHGYTDHPIIHRDIKSSNILLTDHLRAKIADFGFARLAPENPEATHVSTLVKGTAGYVDPDYLRTNQLTDRSDVYSFGVLLVELVTGRRPIEHGRGRHQRLTTEWALRKCREGDTVVAMDPRMRRSSAVVAAVEKVMALAAECMAPDRAARPATRRIAEVLWSVRRDFQQEQQRAAAASAGARRHDGSTYVLPSVTSSRGERSRT
ncbi:hypothetical protein EJB05_18408, partial [Eragrostis curvula]